MRIRLAAAQERKIFRRLRQLDNRRINFVKRPVFTRPGVTGERACAKSDNSNARFRCLLAQRSERLPKNAYSGIRRKRRHLFLNRSAELQIV